MSFPGGKNPEEPPLVASIVLDYGRPDLARRALDSLRASTYPRQRILAVDNGSPRAAELGRAAAEAGAEPLLLERNLGFGGGMNRAVEEAVRRFAPDIFFLLNNDAWVEPDALARLVRAAVERGGQLVGPKILSASLDPAPAGSPSPPPPRIWAAGGELDRFRLIARNRGDGELDRGQFEEAGEHPFLSGCALLVTRDAFERLGGFDPRYFLYQEDVDLCLRAGRLGLRLRYEPSAVVHHLGSATGGSEYGRLQSFYRWRNRLLLFAAHSRGLHRAFLFGGLFPLVALRDLGRYARRGRWAEAGRLFAGLLDLPRARAARPA